MIDASQQIGIGIDTIIQLETPVTVRYETMNFLPLQHLDYKIKGRRVEGDEEFDVEKELPDDVLYGGTALCYIVEVGASCLAVVTHHMQDRFWTNVKRVENHSLPEYLKINPDWSISDFPDEVSLAEVAALGRHRALVDRVRQQYQGHGPRIVYDGSLLLDARFSNAIIS